MTVAVFGTPPPPLLGAPARIIAVHEVEAAADRFAHAGVTLTVTGDTLTVSDGTLAHEHSTSALARAMSTHRVPADGIDDALATWVEHRPISAADMEHRSHWVLDWDDPEEMTLRWTLAIARERQVVLAAPDLFAPADQRRQWRAAAAARSARVSATMTSVGPTTLLATVPTDLSTALLFNPATFPVDPQAMEQNVVVVAPGAALALGPRPVMNRMVTYASAPAVVLTLDEVPARPVDPTGGER